MNDLLQKLYYDPKTGYTSKEKLYRKAKDIDNNITLKIVKEFLETQPTYQITKQIKKPKLYDTIISPAVKNNYQLDIMYLPNSKQNKNFKYLLTCIDVHSRYSIIKKLKNKDGESVFHAFKVIIEEYGQPKNINVDEGKEFVYKPFVKYCNDNDIKIWYSNPEQDNKNAFVERLHRTLRNMILKYEVANDKSYINDLHNLIDNYNNTYHSTIQANPIDIWNGNTKPLQNNKLIIQQAFKVGDKVRHTTNKNTYDKSSSTTNYTKTIYTITKIDGRTYYLDDLKKPFRETHKGSKP
jgi:hypothetical protein